jgi:hypothetical protein
MTGYHKERADLNRGRPLFCTTDTLQTQFEEISTSSMNK